MVDARVVLSIMLAISFSANILQLNLGESCRVSLFIQSKAIKNAAKLSAESEKSRAHEVTTLSVAYKKDISAISEKKVIEDGDPLDLIISEMRKA